MAKVLSIEIGASLIRLCEVDYKEQNPKVYKWATIQTPEGALKDDVIEVSEALVSAIKGVLREKHMHAKKLVFAMNSTKIASREVVIPFVKENKVGEIILANASDFFPVDLDQYELGYSIIGAFDNEKGVKQYKVHVLAAPKTIVESYFELAKALGGSVEALDYSGNSIFQMIRSHCTEGVQMVVKVDERSSIITIVKNQTIALQRTISYGVDDAIAAVMNSSYQDEITYMQAVKTLQEQNCFADEFDMEDDEILDMDTDYGVAQTVQEEVGASLNYLTSGISRVIDYYNSRNTEAVIEKIYVTGLGGDCKGIGEFLSKSLESDVEVLRELQGFRLDKYFKNESFGPYLTCIGAAIAPLGFMGLEAEKGKKLEVVPQKDSMKSVSILVCVGGVLIAGVLAATSYLNVRNMQEENRQLKERVEELQPIKEIYKAYLQQQYTHTKLNGFYRYTMIPNEELVAFIEEMEEKMPSSLNVQAFVSTIEGVDISLSVKDKKEAAKLIQQFRSFESISDVSVVGISDTGAVMEGEPIEQEGKVIFTISLTYKSLEEQEAEQAAKQAAAEAAAEAEQSAETVEQE